MPGKIEKIGRGAVEKWGPALILKMAGLETLDPATEAIYRGFLRDSAPANRFLETLAGDGSWNIPQILAAVRLWAGDKEARRRWVLYCLYQAGVIQPPAELAKLRFLGGSEPLSANYVDWRIGALLAVRLWALRQHDAELLEATGRLITVYAAVGALIAMDQADANVAVNKRGQKIDDAPWVGSPGERSALHHLAGNRRIHLGLALGREVHQVRNPEWDVLLARAVLPDLGISPEARSVLVAAVSSPSPATLQPVLDLLADVRISSEIRVLWWPELRLILNPERNNRNSTAILAEGFDRVTREVWVLHPFEEGRAWQDKDGGRAWIEGGEVIARTGDGREERHAIPEGPPLVEVVMGPEGMRLAGAAAPSPGPSPTPVPVPVPPPPSPAPTPAPNLGADLRALAATLRGAAAEADRIAGLVP